MVQAFVFRRYRQGDEKSIFELAKLCYGISSYEHFMKHWIWEFEKNPFGKYIWIAEYEGKIVSHFSYIPVDLKVGKEIHRCGIATHAMTHPSFRGKGLQRKLQTIARDETVGEGIDVLYWWPLDVFYKHRRKEMGQELDHLMCRIPIMMKFLDTNEIIEEFIRNRLLAKCISIWLNPIVDFFSGSRKSSVDQNVKIRSIARFDDRINSFWEDVSRYFNVIVVRRKDHLNWRYFQRPHSNFKILLAEVNGQICGYIVFISEGKRGFIVDLLVDPRRPDIAQSLIEKTVKELRKERVGRIVCQMLKNNPYHRVLRANGFIRMSSSKYPFGVTDYSPSRTLTKLLINPANWYLTSADIGAQTTV